MSEENVDVKSTNDTDTIRYNLNISNQIYKKIEKIVAMRKVLGQENKTRKGFVLEAMKEKLSKHSDDQLLSNPYKTLRIEYDQEIEKQILKQVGWIKQRNGGHSKKKWILDAVLDKIDAEESKILSEFEDKMKNFMESN